MPAEYSHHSYGQKVLEHLDSRVKDIIEENKTLFNIGLHGPDLLFYYKPLRSNSVNKVGHEMHKETADKFFTRARKVILDCPDKNAAAAYVLGFICHYMLDTECHPIVREGEKLGFSHGEIETEMERVLMEEANLNPINYRTTKHLSVTDREAKVISWFYKGISGDEIRKSVKSMRFYLDLLVAPGKLKRSLIIYALKKTGNYDDMIGLMMKYEPDPECVNISYELKDAYYQSIDKTVELVNEFYQGLESKEAINMRFDRDFG